MQHKIKALLETVDTPAKKCASPRSTRPKGDWHKTRVDPTKRDHNNAKGGNITIGGCPPQSARARTFEGIHV